ncbi:unnamed protein product [Prorocentrum cordatum]|uniref:Uncharacterized protein n=1 Tax=Prorocentrum cordatum TaxID=2364126 RepID=A0ABN9W8V6_9DINO|nr:unnamed protein product [Polarella glacialis]
MPGPAQAPPARADDGDVADVPDPVAAPLVARRGSGLVVLRWPRPEDNARRIDGYQVCVQRWHPGADCGPLPPQDADGLAAADGGQDLELHAAGGDAGGGAHGGGELCLREPPFLGPAGGALPRAVWACARARNSEGWGEWGPASLVFFRGGGGGGALAGVLHTWGLAEDGRLGRGAQAVQRGVCAEAGAVEALSGARVTEVALGSHSAAITAEDELFVWGTFLAGQGSSEAAEQEGPADEVQCLTEPGRQATAFVPHGVACGRFVTAVVSAEGRLFAWGPNEAHQCGCSGGSVLRTISQLQVPRGAPVVACSLGEFHGLPWLSPATGRCSRGAWSRGPSSPWGRTRGTLSAAAAWCPSGWPSTSRSPAAWICRAGSWRCRSARPRARREVGHRAAAAGGPRGTGQRRVARWVPQRRHRRQRSGAHLGRQPERAVRPGRGAGRAQARTARDGGLGRLWVQAGILRRPVHPLRAGRRPAALLRLRLGQGGLPGLRPVATSSRARPVPDLGKQARGAQRSSARRPRRTATTCRPRCPGGRTRAPWLLGLPPNAAAGPVG